tara:strand:- start:5363 stop:8815 length:3453 start_codon:yes stop_codon:yes gene_type:complete
LKNLLVLTLFFITVFSYSQKEAAIWYFGENAGLDFNSGSPVAIHDGKLMTLEGCSTISDINGSLLFYTDGTTVYNKNHEIMPNGEDLKGHSTSTQSAIIVPSPGDPNIYYIFTAHYQAQDGIYYNVLDISLNAGLGDIVTKNVLLKNPAAEKLTAVKHANGKDIWVVAHDWGNDAFLTYLVTPTGVVTTPVISNTGFNLNYSNGGPDIFKAIGYLKASPDGTKMAVCHRHLGVELLDFNAATGELSNPTRLLEGEDSYYGVEFSPNNKILYISEIEDEVYQFDLSATNIASTKVTITQPGEIGGGMQLAIDGKIYMSNIRNLSVINNPNIIGIGCNYEDSTINVEPGIGYYGLPPFITSYFLVSFNADNFCFGDNTMFSINASEPITSILWDFGDGTTSTLESPSHVFTNAGTYTVSVTATTASETKTETKNITIFETPVANPINSLEVCDDLASYTTDLATLNPELLGTQNPAAFSISYHASQLDADTNSNPLAINYTNSNESETLYARISNRNASECYATTNFNITVKQAPRLATVSNWSVCDDDSDGFYDFDLSFKDSEVLNGQDATIFNITYYQNQADADSRTNAIVAPFTNTSASQAIYFRIENDTYNECYQTGSFIIEVISGVAANTIANNTVCDTNNDGFSNFNLSLNDAIVLGLQSPTSFTVSYHSTQQDADIGANALNNTNYTNLTAYLETVYARVVNNSSVDCYGTTFFQLVINDSPVLQTVSDWSVCDTDNDGFTNFDLSQKNQDILGNQSNTDFSVSYYTSQTNADAKVNPILGLWTNTSRIQEVFYNIESNTNPDCYLTSSFNIEVFNTPIANAATNLVACDISQTGNYSFDLSQKDNEILGGQSPTEFSITYYTSEYDALANQNSINKTAYTNQQAKTRIYARISNQNLEACLDITSFELILNSLPEISLEETYVICPDSPDLSIDGGHFETYSWKNNEGIELSTNRNFEPPSFGTYSFQVTATSNGTICENTVNFEVISSGAPESITIDTNGFSDEIQLIVNAEGIGEFEYSLDGINYQTNNEFEVFPGTYEVYVRDPFECRILTESIFVLGYQKFFTPNGDSINDFWNIIGGDAYPNSVVNIYDRYGKLIKQLSANSAGWDGMFEGRPLPASDYWFSYSYNNGKTEKGHFSLKR